MPDNPGISRTVLAWRLAHAGIAATFLSVPEQAIALVWWSALTRRRVPLLRPAVAALLGEGALVAVNHGDCPLGGFQQRVGDQTPLFELVLSPRAAKRAVPVLGAVTAAGLVALAARQPERRNHGEAREIA